MQIPLGILIMTPCLWLVSRPKPYLLAGIYALIFSGVYSINHSLLDLWIVLAAGVLGYGLRCFGFPFLPLVLGLILGHMIESSYRRSLVLSRRRPRDLPPGPGLGRAAGRGGAARARLARAQLVRRPQAAARVAGPAGAEPRRLRLRPARIRHDGAGGRGDLCRMGGGARAAGGPGGGARGRGTTRCSTSPACASRPGARTTSARRSPPGMPKAGAPHSATPAAWMPPARR